MTLLATLILILTLSLSRLVAGDDPYPFCSPSTNPNCIDGGRYLVPILDFSNQGDPGDNAYNQYLPTHPYTLARWTNGKWPYVCQKWGVDADSFNATDFIIYNVTYPDQCPGSPWVVCYHKRASVTIDQVATVLSKLPVRMRQALSTYMVYSLDNPKYGGVIATLGADGIIVGRSDFFFTTALVHEHGHAVDSNLIGTGPPGTNHEFSTTNTWHNAVNADYCAVSAYGAGSYVEDFAEAGRAVLLDNIYPGGLVAFSNHNPNLTQISHQVATCKTAVGNIYVPGGSCNLTAKFPFPSLVDQTKAVTTTTTSPITTPPPTATAGPYSQCGGISFTGYTTCGGGYKCSSLNSYYFQCIPTTTRTSTTVHP